MKLLITATITDAPIDGPNRRSWEGEQGQNSTELTVKDWHGDGTDGHFDSRGAFRSVAAQNGFIDVSFIHQDEKRGDVELGDEYDHSQLEKPVSVSPASASTKKEETHAELGVGEQPRTDGDSDGDGRPGSVTTSTDDDDNAATSARKSNYTANARKRD